MCCLQNIAMRDYQESATTRQTQTDRQTPDKVMPLCHYALLATQLWYRVKGLVTRNTHVQYEISIPSGLKVMAKVKVFVQAHTPMRTPIPGL